MDPSRSVSPPLAFCVAPDAEAMSRRAAELIEARVRARPDLLLCAATGATPTRAYQLFAGACLDRPGLADGLRIVKLDEWGGLPMDHPATCETYLRRHLLGPLSIAEDRYVGWRSDPVQPSSECWRIAGELFALGPIDLCVLGLGVNGHLGFNEPADELTPGPHVATLSPESLRHPMLSGATPGYGLTLGMGDILRSREVLLLVSGAHKREPMRRLMAGCVSTRFPASLLLLHPRVTVMCDRDAAGDVEGERERA